MLQVQDADTALDGTGETFDGVTIPTGFDSDASGDEFHRITTHEYDAQHKLVGPYKGVTADKRVRQAIRQDEVYVADMPGVVANLNAAVRHLKARPDVTGRVGASTFLPNTSLVGRFDLAIDPETWAAIPNALEGLDRLSGERVRKNFKDRAEAAAEKSALELKALQLASGLRSAATFLSDDELREAEAAFRRLFQRYAGLTPTQYRRRYGALRVR